ncbi:MAG: hypothetical protein PHQ04_05205 [Opitutaceae bacterium]|nr:hypothetical protein [Opitutaceae bacterium]
MRPPEARLPVARHIFLNPYRARLIDRDTPWKWSRCDSADRSWFNPNIDRNLPRPE